MQESEVKELAINGYFQGQQINGKIIETHISWVLFSEKYAFKIKKPLKLQFLDFSTLKLREKYCHKEVALNSRFSHIYLDVIPINLSNNIYSLDGGEEGIAEYAVRMKKLQQAKKMDVLLEKGKVKVEDIKNLARQISTFHKNSKIINKPYRISVERGLFNEIGKLIPFINEKLGKKYAKVISNAIDWSDRFLIAHEARFRERIKKGFKRDVHGDLHSGNIFLYKNPVIFDCIEFNDDFRQIDVLYELAFLCMDLEAYKENEFANTLLMEYRNNIKVFEKKEDEAIFLYYKCLRANVRAKVHVLRAIQENGEKEVDSEDLDIIKYIDLMETYLIK